MQSDEENLRIAKADNQPDVKISYEDLISEVTKELCLPELDEEKDVTVARLVKETGLSSNAIRDYAKKKIDAGIWQPVKKRGKFGNPITVFVAITR